MKVRDLLPERLITLVIIGLPSTIIAICGILWYSGHQQYIVLASYLIFPSILAPITFSYLPRKNNNYNILSLNRARKLVITSYCILLSLATLLLIIQSYRSIVYYVIISGQFALLFLYFHLRRKIIYDASISLFLIFILSLQIILGQTFTHSFYIGRTDVIGHSSVVYTVVERSDLSGFTETYSAFPFWHIYSASVYEIINISAPVRFSLYLLSSLVFSSAVYIVYCFATRIGLPSSTALIAVAFTVLTAPFLLYGSYSISRGIVGILFIYLLYCIIRYSSRFALLGIILLFISIVFHPASPPFIFLVLITFAITNYITFDNVQKINRLLMIFTTLTIGYWLAASEHIFFRLVMSLINVISLSSSSSGGSGPSFDFYAEAFNFLHFSFPLFLLIIAFLFVMDGQEQYHPYVTSCVLMSVIFSIFYFPGLVQMFEGLTTINIGRFNLYTFLFIAIVAAIGYVAIANRVSHLGLTILLFLVFTSSFLAVSNDFVASDTSVIERETYTTHLDESEISGYEFVSEHNQDIIASDYVTCRYFTSQYTPNIDCQIFTINSGEYSNTAEMYVERNRELKDRGLQIRTADRGKEYVGYYGHHSLQGTNRNNIYSSGSITISN